MDKRTIYFRQLHTTGQILRLPNAWDVATAKLFESLGAKAIATTSAGVAWSLGYADGNKLPAALVVGLAESMGRVLKVPLSVDIEGGYSDDPAKVAQLARQLVDVGVAGINIEDARESPDLLVRKIVAIKEELGKRGGDLFVNARTDVFLAQLVPSGEMLTETLRRTAQYTNAGADGIFIPGMAQVEHIEKAISRISLPINLLAWKGLPNAAVLEQLGIRRLSAGSAVALTIWGYAERVAKDFVETGHSEALLGPMSYAQMQRLFS